MLEGTELEEVQGAVDANLEADEKQDNNEGLEDSNELNPDGGEAVDGEKKDEAGADKANPDAKVYYTPEEMRALDPAVVDTSRIPPEMLPFYKSMQSNWNRKYQEVASIRKEAEAKTVPPKTIEEAFDRDPQGVMTSINTEINRLRADINRNLTDNPFEALKLQNEVARLQDMRLGLVERRQMNSEQLREMEAARVQVEAEVLRAIPDFEAKSEKLTAFAVEKLGYTHEDLLSLTNPVIMGPQAAKFTLAINRMYDMANAGQTLKGKEAKSAPPKTEKPGSGGFKSKPTSVTDSSDDDFESLIAKAKNGELRL